MQQILDGDFKCLSYLIIAVELICNYLGTLFDSIVAVCFLPPYITSSFPFSFPCAYKPTMQNAFLGSTVELNNFQRLVVGHAFANF